MKIAFYNSTALIYDVATPFKEPLGGSESAMCYLSIELAKLGHEVYLLNRKSKKRKVFGVICLPVDQVSEEFYQGLDILVIQNTPYLGVKIKPFLGKKTKLVFWNQHAHDQSAIEHFKIPEVRGVFDYFVFISSWQKKSYLDIFNLNPRKSIILKNAISPFFEGIFNKKEKILDQKKENSLVYTTTPFRGLELLIDVFPKIGKIFPKIKLKIFSSLKVYQVPQKEDEKSYGKLYQKCKKTKNVDYIGSVNQKRLAKELKKAAIFAYPNTFAETSCISAMEAMAAGCQVVTSDLAALPETTAGFATLISVKTSVEVYLEEFIKEVIFALNKNINRDKKLEKKLRRQVDFVNKNYTWKKRAQEWYKFFQKITSKKPGSL